MVYGYIYIEKNNKKYIADIQWSTVSAFGFHGFSINIYAVSYTHLFNKGDYNSTDIETQCEAGWSDWFCSEN